MSYNKELLEKLLLTTEELKNKVYLLEKSHSDTVAYCEYLVANLDKTVSVIDLLIQINNFKKLDGSKVTVDYLLENVQNKELMDKIVQKNVRLRKLNKLIE